MEIEASTSGGGRGSGNVSISTTTFSVNVNEEPLELEELELPETAFHSRHHQLLNSLVTDDSDDYGDIQFFHHHSHIQQQLQFQHQQQQQQHDHFVANGNADFEGVDVSNISTTGTDGGNNMNGNHSNNSSENPFIPMMDQFFPGRSIEGYLETILEETDEEFEEEECSGRHWWVADSDTDTDSVIRVESDSQKIIAPSTQAQVSSNNNKDLSNDGDSQMSGIVGGGGGDGKNTFRTTASSKPFGHLFDQLDFDFEETLMGLEPRRRSGIVQSSGEQSARLLAAEQPFEEVEKCETLTSVVQQRNNLKLLAAAREHGTHFGQQQQDNMSYLLKCGNGKCLEESPELDDEEIQPAEVNEEDFFYTTSEDSDGSSGENSEATSSDDGGDGKNDGVVLAEFSLNSSMCNRYRRSFEGGGLQQPSSKLKSFRSFDSLNSLAGTELLFSKADTFPSFHYIKEVTEPSRSSVGCVGGGGSGVVGGEGEVGRNRKNSDSSAERPTEMSTENLSEDSGIGGDGTVGSALNLNSPQQSSSSNLNSLPSISSANNETSLSFIAKSEFALNPFVFSSASASEENSMNSSLFHAVSATDGREQCDSCSGNSSSNSQEEKKEGGNFSFSSSSPNNNQTTVIMRSTQDTIKKNDNSQVLEEEIEEEEEVEEEEEKECKGTHPTSQVKNLTLAPSSSSQIEAKFAQTQLLSSVEPDVVAQCNMMTTTTTTTVGHNITSCGVGEAVGEPQAIPPIVVMREKVEGLTPLVNSIIGGSGGGNLTPENKCEFPTPRSEVLLKFMDEEDMKMENDFSKSQTTRRMVKESESEFVEEKEEVVEEDGANNVDGLAAAHMTIESMVNTEKCMTVSEARIESGPMSALSSVVVDAAAATTGLTLVSMGSPSLAQNNNNSTTTPSHCKESLLLENELPPLRTTCTLPTTAVHTTTTTNTNAAAATLVHEQHEQQQPSVAESVCVQTSGWTNVVHHQPVPHSVRASEEEEEESVEFISGPSKFGCKNSLEEEEEGFNLDPQSGSESLAPTEHLCNSTRNTVEEIIRPADNGISASESNQSTTTTTVVIEKPGSSHIITSPPRAVEGEQRIDESLSLLSTSFVPDILSLSATTDSGSTTTTTISKNKKETTTMEVMERRSMSPSSSPSSGSASSMQPAIKTKTYGPRNEVEVFLVSSRTPSPSMKVSSSTEESASSPLPSSSETLNSSGGGKVVKKEVHFCPVVSEISWRESYTDQGSEYSESSDNLLDDQDSICVDDHHHSVVDGGKNVRESVTVSEQVTQPIENIVLRSTSDNISGMTSSSQNNTNNTNTAASAAVVAENEIKVMSRNNNSHSVENTNGHVYEDVGGNVSDLNMTVSPSQNHQQQQPSTTLSMVPDLLSQCENASQPSHTHISVKIEEKGTASLPYQQHQQHHQQSQQQQQQQIFPSIFADKNEGKNGNKSKKSSGKSFNIPLGTGGAGGGKKNDSKEKDKLRLEIDINNKEDATGKDSNSGNNSSKSKQSKPGFFERLSKIRLSGGSKNKNKKKVHPKENENVLPSNDSSLRNHNNDEDSRGAAASTPTKNVQQRQQPVINGKSPILKKYPANSPTPVSTSPLSTPISQYDGTETDGDAVKSNEAFDHILEDIAGINIIKLRQQQQQQHGRLVLGPSPNQKIGGTDGGNKVRSFAERKQFFVNLPSSRNGQELDAKLTQFKEDTTRTRDTISKSHPDLEIIEGVTRDSLSVTIEPARQHHHDSHRHHQQEEEENRSTSPSQRMTGSGGMGGGSEQKTEREWYRLLKSAAEKYQKNFKDKERNFRTGVVETDLDTGASREMLNLDGEVVELDKVPCTTASTNAKTRSLTNLSTSKPLSLPHGGGPQELDHHEKLPPQGDLSDSDERAKSLEFLLDENHKSSSVPPENTLRLENRQLSEHELRIQRSLQKLNVPEWYKKSVEPNSGASKSTSNIKLLKRSEFGSASGLGGARQGGWSAYRSSRESLMSPSSFETLSGLPNNGRYSGSLNRSNFVRGRPATRSSRESLLSPSSTASHSPSAFERCSFTYGMPLHMSRFNSRLSTGSGQSPPMSISPPSTPVNPVGPTYVKKPYLGWRSQEKLNAANNMTTTGQGTTGPVPLGSSSGLRLSIYRPPAERAAAEIISSRNKKSSSKPTGADLPPLPPPRAEKTVLTIKNPEMVPCNPPTSSVHDSIREVTQQINQFVHHGDAVVGDQPPPKPKPRQKSGKRPAMWIESSFL